MCTFSKSGLIFDYPQQGKFKRKLKTYVTDCTSKTTEARSSFLCTFATCHCRSSRSRCGLSIPPGEPRGLPWKWQHLTFKARLSQGCTFCLVLLLECSWNYLLLKFSYLRVRKPRPRVNMWERKPLGSYQT